MDCSVTIMIQHCSILPQNGSLNINTSFSAVDPMLTIQNAILKFNEMVDSNVRISTQWI